MKLTIYTDGGSRGNPGPAAAGFIIKDQNGRVLVEKGIFLGHATNNQAEYLGVVNALSWVYSHKISLTSLSGIDFFIDSELVIKQIQGEYQIKNQGLRSLVHNISSLQKKIGAPCKFKHVKREQNKIADKLVNQTLDSLTN